MCDDGSGSRRTIEYHPATDTYRTEFSTETAPASTVVVEVVADLAGVGVLDLDPLSEVVDPGALDALFAPSVTGESRSDGEVVFTYHGYEVAVRSYGVIAVRETEDTH